MTIPAAVEEGRSTNESDPAREAAADAGLRYVSDCAPGIRRVRCGGGFRYIDAEGTPVRAASVLRRIKSLAVPPAWTDVWICRSAGGHLQATGRDARGRKQYRYHDAWRQVRDSAKFDRLLSFGERLGALRARVDEDLRNRRLDRRTIAATVVRLMDETLIRVGNEEYARENDSFGMTTLRPEHVEVCGSTIRFRFRGKHGKLHDLAVSDPVAAHVVRRCQELPGQELFQCRDEEGGCHRVESTDVNAYLHEAVGGDRTAKDLRTWGATVAVLEELLSLGSARSVTQAKENVAAAIRVAADRLHNTAATCKNCYVHPAVIEAYMEGVLAARVQCVAGSADDANDANDKYLRPGEVRLLRFLRRLSENGAKRSRQCRAPDTHTPRVPGCYSTGGGDVGKRTPRRWIERRLWGCGMPMARVGDVEIFYQEAGSGYPLILSHEFAGSWESWRDQVRFFSRRYRVITYNDRGYPPSSVPEDPAAYSEEQSVEDLRGLMDFLGIGQAHIGGLSMGGAITLKFGIAHPERCRSLIIAGAGSGTTNREEFLREQDKTAAAFEQQGSAAVAEFYAHGPARVQFEAKDPVGFREFFDLFSQHSASGSARTMRGVQMRRRSIYEVEDEMRGVNVPALILVGDEDELCLEPALFMKRVLPNAGLAILPKSGHTINLEEPALFNQLVLDFLTRVEQGAWLPRSEVSTSMLPASARP